MTTKHEIEIDGLPDGYEVDRVIIRPDCEYTFSKDAEVILRKIKPRRIVLEETDQNVPVGSMAPVSDCPVLVMCTDKIWSVKEE